MNSYLAASDMGDTSIGHRSDCILQCLNDDFDQESDCQPPRLDVGNVYDADLADNPHPPPPKKKPQTNKNKNKKTNRETTAKVESKTVKKFQSRKRIKSADSQQLGDNEKYLVDKLVKLEETRMEQHCSRLKGSLWRKNKPNISPLFSFRGK